MSRCFFLNICDPADLVNGYFLKSLDESVCVCKDNVTAEPNV